MKPIEASWLAAAIDGEGTILIQGRKTARLAVYNTDRRFVKKAAGLIGCSIYMVRFNSTLTARPKPMFSAQTNNHLVVARALRETLPFLIIKQALAKKAIKFIETKEWGLTDGGRQRISEAVKSRWDDPEHRAIRSAAISFGRRARK